MSGITDANGHSIASEKPESDEEVKAAAEEKGQEMLNPAVVPTGMLDYNLCRHIVDMVMLEANLAQMKMQMQMTKAIVAPPEFEMLQKHHKMISTNIQLMVDEKNARFALVDEKRAEEYKASLEVEPTVQ